MTQGGNTKVPFDWSQLILNQGEVVEIVRSQESTAIEKLFLRDADGSEYVVDTPPFSNVRVGYHVRLLTVEGIWIGYSIAETGETRIYRGALGWCINNSSITAPGRKFMNYSFRGLIAGWALIVVLGNILYESELIAPIAIIAFFLSLLWLILRLVLGIASMRKRVKFVHGLSVELREKYFVW